MHKNKNLVCLVTPSWVVNVVAVTCALVLPVTVIALNKYQTSDLQSQVSQARQQGVWHTGAAYQTVSNNLASNHVLGVAPLFIVWACVGLGVYLLTISIVRTFHEVFELHEELEYVHVSRHDRVHEALVHFVLRAVTALGWFVVIKLTISVLVPFALTLSSIASVQASLTSVLYVLLAIILIYVTVCGHAIFIRLLFRRSRLLG